jgi:RecA-family ATPase
LIKSAYTLIEEAVHDVPHLIQPLLPEEGIMVLAGHSGTYKTWHGLQLCLDGALGLPWLDHPDLSIRSRSPACT